MPFDRGAWEQTTSRGASNQTRIANGETVNRPSNVSAKISGGISFCPACGAMMNIKNGGLTCTQCGYREYSASSTSVKSKTRPTHQKRQIKPQQQKIKQQMQDVLSYMYKGKTRTQASTMSGIPMSKISNWYNEGKSGYGRDNIHFYHEVSSIEKDQEMRRRAEINRQNRLKEEERKRKQRENERKQREAKQRRERLQKQSEDKTIKKQMDEIVKQMRNGETRSQAAINVGVPIYKVDEWYDMGWRRKKEPYTSFYNKVNTIEIRNRKTSQSKTVTHSKDNTIKQMRRIISLMKNGLTRSQAAKRLDLNVSTVNDWYNKGSHGDSVYVKFYNDVKSIESSQKKTKSTYIPKSTTSNLVKCHKCGKKYNKKLNKECPNCKKTKALAEIKYCQNCGKQITNDDLYYCSNCGVSLKTGKKSKSSTNVTSKKDDSSDWITCCVAVFVLFMIMAFLGLLI